MSSMCGRRSARFDITIRWVSTRLIGYSEEASFLVLLRWSEASPG
jgi:hypothetical protein